jgi:hypothetical protein
MSFAEIVLDPPPGTRCPCVADRVSLPSLADIKGLHRDDDGR